MGDVLQPVLTQIPQSDAVGQVVLDHGPGGVREQYLPAVAGGGDPRGPVDVDPDVVTPAEDTLPVCSPIRTCRG